jgi:hypothetical protein
MEHCVIRSLLYEAAPIKPQTGGKQCEQRWVGNTGQSAISCTDQARLHRLTRCIAAAILFCKFSIARLLSRF